VNTRRPRWYRAHNASVVEGYLEHRDLAEAEGEAERFFMNVALARVLFAHALVAAPRLAAGRLAPHRDRCLWRSAVYRLDRGRPASGRRSARRFGRSPS